ncbi:properdin [Microcaecilia unicolor]|uniref:Properdin n=1 Tax=Microcaecilia unicolor TaxID=1415580 RepID=A0A6P7XCC9_9AMPH|nr:properdin [Microcaecilia unicolor]XP_030048251.1 properdin [Microcaecilia unicolor]
MVIQVSLLVSCFLAMHLPVSEGVSCYGNFDDSTGKCLDFISDDVTQEDCCLNLKYGFKRSADGSCEACYPAEWSEWSPWQGCSVTCLEGVQQRRKHCYGQGKCEEDQTTLETRSCIQQHCCLQDGGWSNWLPWSACSVTCAKGIMQRRRECTNPAPQCGGTCRGNSQETSACNTNQVCPTHGEWGNWGSWSECSATCIKEHSSDVPTHLRYRQCNNPPPSSNPPGKLCPGLAQEKKACSGLPPCPVDGGWGAWRKNNECSVTCGIGVETQRRECNNPAPQFNGKDCVGSQIRTTVCNTGLHCPIDGRWSEWSEWTDCIRPLQDKIRCTKTAGQQSRKRKCEQRDYGGLPCKGLPSEVRNCYNSKGCFYQGTWSDWSDWGLCIPPCGKSEKIRQRLCEPIYPNYPNSTGIQKISPIVFWGTPIAQCQPLDGQKRKVEEKTDCLNPLPCDSD